MKGRIEELDKHPHLDTRSPAREYAAFLSSVLEENEYPGHSADKIDTSSREERNKLKGKFSQHFWQQCKYPDPMAEE